MFPELKNYSIIREIGSGGMAVVYEAIDRRLKRTVALKMLHPHLRKDWEATNRFKREALAAAKIDHPHIVRIFEYFFEQDAHCIAMEYVPGTDMGSIMQCTGALELPVVIAVMTQIAAALAEAHGMGIIHRDIKPANILIHKQGRAMLSDFGLAHHRLDSRLTLCNTAAGTPAYMSPEQIAGNGIGPSSDVYSWAVTFHHLLSGKFPYPAQRFPDIIAAIRHGTIVCAEDIQAQLPPLYYDLLMRCLQTSPAERIADGMELTSLIGQCNQKNPMPYNIAQLLQVSRKPGDAVEVEESSDSKTSVYVTTPRTGRKRALWAVGITGIVCLAIPFALPSIRRSAPTPSTPVATLAGKPTLPDTQPTPVMANHDPAPRPRRLPAISPPHATVMARRPSPLDSGQLFVYCEPWATVYINNREVGATPLDRPIGLPTGVYHIRLINAHCIPYEDTLTVTSGTILRKRYTLQMKTP
jgi:serine/threonine protein kinase